MTKLPFASRLFFALLICGPAVRAADWKLAPVALTTPWTDKVDPDHPLPEYPRPQMVRDQWTNLNGLWDYAIEPRDAAAPEQYDGKILVPYPLESALSGVRRQLLPEQALWYRRALQVSVDSGRLGVDTDRRRAGQIILRNGYRWLLHFGAVDWQATVSLNGKQIGEHKGGYDSFTFDITDALHDGGNELIVRVWDPTGTNGSPHGKQQLGAFSKPSGIMYTPCSGIWQTVWLEEVPAQSIASLKLTPEPIAGVLLVSAEVLGNMPGLTFKAVALDGNQEIASASGKVGNAVVLPIKNEHLWSPDDPYLYTLRVDLVSDGHAVDSVASYFGMRKIALGKDDKGILRPLLNGKFVFQSGPLDQGFWPDGIYTAPTDDALRYDIEMTKKLGFNMTRKHVKVEPDRWYYWCDKLGLLVWQDMPAGSAGKDDKKDHDGVPASAEKAEQFETELRALIEQHINHPAIVMWVVFNEGWGQYDTPRLTAWVKSLDPTRLVNEASGWNDRQVGDVIDMHNYPGPGSPAPEATRAAVLGEFGGLGLAVPSHTWVEKSWGYRVLTGQKALTRKYLDLWKKVWELREKPGLSAAVYTQLTDVETECNGLLTYDRRVVKVDAQESAAAIARGEFPAPPEYRVIVPTAQAEPVAWRYTLAQPAADWYKPAFDASAWKEAPAGFGTKRTPGAIMRTEWKMDDIWLRRTVTLPDMKFKDLMLRIHHDDDAEVYLNGVLAAKMGGYLTDYDEVEVAPEALAALKPGENLIAVHCHQVYGGQYIDLGLVVPVPPTK